MSLFFGIAFWGAAVRVLSTRSFSLYLVLLTLFSNTNGYYIPGNSGPALLGKHFAVERSLWVLCITPGPNHSWTPCKEWGKTGRMLADLPENQRCGISSHWLATEHLHCPIILILIGANTFWLGDKRNWLLEVSLLFSGLIDTMSPLEEICCRPE